MMNLKLELLENEEGPALGVAMLAAVGCGEYPDVASAAENLVKSCRDCGTGARVGSEVRGEIPEVSRDLSSSESIVPDIGSLNLSGNGLRITML